MEPSYNKDHSHHTVKYCEEQVFHYSQYRRKQQRHTFRLYSGSQHAGENQEWVQDLITLCKKEEECISQILAYWRGCLDNLR